MPPFVGMAVKVTDVPAQIFELDDEIETLGTAVVFTVTKTVSLDVQLPLFAVKIYAVVDVGLAMGFTIVALLNPVDGLHK